ncbi:hypothetical protein PMAYCL1PPCAC_05644 [Pristionchus mayeri]|uniref:G protein-coupled receptor n=1 Tax=Pristionchus mayeri TaxID=1317129 RepID=A0AAN5CAZ4_9BILA|nr:hypothetical protein PMAYCL1PPCAC_05644 [Pristionchus mayeri]
MIGAQFQFVPFMLQGEEYNCSSVMPPGPEWAEQYGVKRIPFGLYSLIFGLVTEILYIPCTLGLRRDMKTSCFKIMFWLSIMDMIAIMANCVGFGVLLIMGDVYCSNRFMTLGVGIVGYCIWCCASACCLVLGVNRLFEMLNLSRFFSVRNQRLEMINRD